MPKVLIGCLLDTLHYTLATRTVDV